MGKNISYYLHKGAKSQNVSQAFIAESLNYSKSTVNGYFNDSPAPCDFMESVSALLDDSGFNVGVAHDMFGTIPEMEVEMYHENPVILDILQKQQANERKKHKEVAQLILTKRNEHITSEEQDLLRHYANEFLDELLVETKIIMQILSVCEVSMMTAIKERRPHWVVKGYVRR